MQRDLLELFSDEPLSFTEGFPDLEFDEEDFPVVNSDLSWPIQDKSDNISATCITEEETQGF